MDDVEIYKTRLIEKLIFVENETSVRLNARNFNRRKIIEDDGITFYGNPRNLDHIYTIISKIRNNEYRIDSQYRRTALEEIALYIQNKDTSFLRFFRFTEGIITSLSSNDPEIVELSLFLLCKLADDIVLCEELLEKKALEPLR